MFKIPFLFLCGWPVRILLLVAMMAWANGVHAQQRCVTEEVEQIRRQRNPGVPQIAEFEKWMDKKLLISREQITTFGTEGVDEEPFIIPVVVHIIHNGEPVGQGTNLSDTQILSQIQVINEDFNRLNADTVLTRNLWNSVAGKLNVEFVLARRDPQGMPTNGIVRKQGAQDQYSPFRRDLIAAESYWPAEDYLNIWVTDLTNSYLGIAQYPDIALPGLEDEEKENRLTDGVYISYKVFGSALKDPTARLSAKYDQGRTCTHEIGHYLGLRHVWGDDLFNCDVDDYVEDTPASNENYNGGCPVSAASCGSEDMFENYLYYTADACMNIFTAEQVMRMAVVLEYAPRRASLAASLGAIPPEGSFFDIAITSAVYPGVVDCGGYDSYLFNVRNNGTQEIQGFVVDYALDDGTQERMVFDQILSSGGDTDIEVPSIPAFEGPHSLYAAVDFLLPATDVNLSDNTLSKIFLVNDSRDFIPLRQDFEDEAAFGRHWSVLNYDGLTTWELEQAGGRRPGNVSAFINLYDYSYLFAEDWLISPALDFTEAVAASLSFRVSYARRIGRGDRLRVLASDDCGNSFRENVLDLSAIELSDATSDDYWVPQARTDWKEFSVDLSQYAGKSDVRIAFVSVNNQGNNLYLDDVEFYTTAEEKVLDLAENNFVLHPNPATDGFFKITVYTALREDLDVVVYSAEGREVHRSFIENALNQTFEFNLGVQPRGMYFVKVVGNGFVRTKKLIVQGG